MTVIVTLLGLWALLIAGRGTPIGRMLERGLVETPARQIGRISRGHVLLALALAGTIGLVFLILDYEGIRLMSMAAPEIASFLTAFEISTWLDAAATAIVAASALRWRICVNGSAEAVRARPARAAATARARLRRLRTTTSPPRHAGRPEPGSLGRGQACGLRRSPWSRSAIQA